MTDDIYLVDAYVQITKDIALAPTKRQECEALRALLQVMWEQLDQTQIQAVLDDLDTRTLAARARRWAKDATL